MKNHITQLVQNYQPSCPADEDFKQRTLEFLSQNEEVTSRKNFNGHITASAFVVNRAHTHVLMVEHAKLNRWVQPGGHVEAEDSTLLGASMREVAEETGVSDIKALDNNIFDIDIHPIPESPKKAEAAHQHLDMRFLLEAQSDELTISDESTDIKWVAMETVEHSSSESVARMARKAKAMMLANNRS